MAKRRRSTAVKAARPSRGSGGTRRFIVEIRVGLKTGVTDAEGAATEKSLKLLGFAGVRQVRSVRVFELDVAANDSGAARRTAEEMCRRLLANPVIHRSSIEVRPARS